jgi:epoxyqueuosine reductase
LDVLAINNEAFKSRYYGSPNFRIKRERLVRNACIAAGNWGSDSAIPALMTLLDDGSPFIRGHAAWAIGQIPGASAKRLLSDQRQRETDAEVIREISQTLDEL